MNIKYEAISTFYFIYGIIGQGEKFCERLFNTLGEILERPYGVWMRVESKCRFHTMGSKWLRSGGFNTAASMGVDGGDSGNKVVSENEGKGDNASKKSGIAVENALSIRITNEGEN